MGVNVLDGSPLADPLAHGRGRSLDENLDVVCGAYAVKAGPDESGGVGGGQRVGPESCPGAAPLGNRIVFPGVDGSFIWPPGRRTLHPRRHRELLAARMQGWSMPSA